MSIRLTLSAALAVCVLASTASAAGPCVGPLGDWWQPQQPTPTYDGDHCAVDSVPVDSHPFTYNNRWYVSSVRDDCPLGSFDGANCRIQAAPPGAFIYQNRFYTPAPTPGVCPPGTDWNGVHCRWHVAPQGTTAFTYDGSWYTTPLPRCPSVGRSDGVHCFIGRPPAGTTALLDGREMKYTYEEVLTAEAARFDRACGDSYDAHDLSGCMNREAPPPPSIMRSVSKADGDYHPDHYAAVRYDSEGRPVAMGPPLPEDEVTHIWPDGSQRMGDRSQLPAYRSSNDGRLVMDFYPGGPYVPGFRVLRPEALGYDDEVGADAPWSAIAPIPHSAIFAPDRPFSNSMYNYTLCDASGASVDPTRSLSTDRNPRSCNATVDGAQRPGDCYDIALIYAPSVTVGGVERLWLGSIDMTLFVSDPKTADARVWVYPRTQGTTLGSQPNLNNPAVWAPHRRERDTFHVDINGNGQIDQKLFNPSKSERWFSAAPAGRELPDGTSQTALQFFEPTTTSDGKVIIFNLMHGLYYSVSDAGPCRADGFGRLVPLSYMPVDPQVDLDLARAGAATGGFRDPNGQVISPGTRITGAYMWLDRQGKNLFFSRHGKNRSAWYADESWPAASLLAPTNPDQGVGKGVVALGAWTQGKMIVVDNLLNATDFGGVSPDAAHSVTPADAIWFGGNQTSRPYGHRPNIAFDMKLYQGDPVPIRPSGTLLINSYENQLNHLDHLSPTLPFDVVWRLTSDNGHTAEMAFDDYMDNRALVVAHMNASQKCVEFSGGWNPVPTDGFLPQAPGRPDNDPHGFDFRFVEPPLLQNASTAHAAFDPGAVVGPANLQLMGGARVEPVALGGVLGRGVYLDGRNDFVDMHFPDTLHGDWYFGIWLDNRDPDTLRRLFEFPDMSAVEISGSEMSFVNPSSAQNPRQSIDLSALALPRGQFVHYGVTIRRSATGTHAELRINGDPTPAGSLSWGTNTGFRLQRPYVLFGPNRFAVGNSGRITPSAPTVRGWIDELRIYALKPNDTVVGTAAWRAWRERGCNIALGTIAEDPTGALYCEQIALVDHATPLELGPQYGMAECIDRVHRNPDADPAIAARCHRRNLLGTESHKVRAGSSRAEFRGNPFCGTCHVDQHPIPGLGLDALASGASTIGTPLRECDGRRQPMDWPAIIGGATLSGTAPSGSHPACAPATLPGANGSTATLSDPWFDIHGRWTP